MNWAIIRRFDPAVGRMIPCYTLQGLKYEVLQYLQYISIRGDVYLCGDTC